MTPGAVLAGRRAERGLTLEQASAATRIKSEHLGALEADEIERLPAPVYTRGYLRTYARYLGLDPEPLVDSLRASEQDPRRTLGLGTVTARPRLALTAPAVAAIGLLVLAGAFGFYAWRQIDSNQRSPSAPPGPVSPLAAASPPATPLPSPTPQQRPIVVGVRVADSVWLNVIVDGKSQYSDSGKILPAGSVVYFTGLDIKITSGKGAATFITIDNQPLGTLGTGVVTREFTAP